MSYSLFATPIPASDGGAGAYTLGMVFSTLVGGDVQGVRFYKKATNTGTHVGTLWSIAGSVLAQVTFTGETSSGWQYMAFGTPYTLTPSTQYVVTYNCTIAHMYTAGATLITGYVLGNPLGAPANYGCYYSGVGNLFPNVFSDPNTYFVDVVLDNVVRPVSARSNAGSQGVVGALQGINLGGPTAMYQDNGFGRHLQTGVRKESVEGNPASPCLALDYPGFWRFRWGVTPGTRTIAVFAKQVSNVTGKRPSLIVKANPALGVNSDVSGAVGSGAGWGTIGPITVTPSGTGALWVELHNNDTDTFSSPAFFDHIVAT